MLIAEDKEQVVKQCLAAKAAANKNAEQIGADPEDFLQEATTRALETVDRFFEPSRGTLEGFANSVMTSCLRPRLYRKKLVIQEAVPAKAICREPVDQPPQMPGERSLVDVAAAIRRNLTPSQLRIIDRLATGLTPIQVAKELGLTRQRIYEVMKQARKEVRRCL